MSRKFENGSFVCANCGVKVAPLSNGSYRNHCPACLYSLHVDETKPGDRNSNCRGLMKPIGIKYHTKKGFQIRHRCLACGVERLNIVAEHTEMPDDFDLVLRLMSMKK